MLIQQAWEPGVWINGQPLATTDTDAFSALAGTRECDECNFLHPADTADRSTP